MNKGILIFIGVMVVIGILVTRMAKQIIPGAQYDMANDPTNPEISAKSDEDATTAMMIWKASRPQAQAAIPAAGQLDVNPATAFFPDFYTVSTGLTDASPSPTPPVKMVA